MTSVPCAASVNKSFECGALIIIFWKIVEPDHDVVVGEVVIVQVRPVAGGVECEVVLFGDELKEVEGVFGEVNVVHFTSGGVEGGNFEGVRLGDGRGND